MIFIEFHAASCFFYLLAITLNFLGLPSSSFMSYVKMLTRTDYKKCAWDSAWETSC